MKKMCFSAGLCCLFLTLGMFQIAKAGCISCKQADKRTVRELLDQGDMETALSKAEENSRHSLGDSEALRSDFNSIVQEAMQNNRIDLAIKAGFRLSKILGDVSPETGWNEIMHAFFRQDSPQVDGHTIAPMKPKSRSDIASKYDVDEITDLTKVVADIWEKLEKIKWDAPSVTVVFDVICSDNTLFWYVKKIYGTDFLINFNLPKKMNYPPNTIFQFGYIAFPNPNTAIELYHDAAAVKVYSDYVGDWQACIKTMVTNPLPAGMEGTTWKEHYLDKTSKELKGYVTSARDYLNDTVVPMLEAQGAGPIDE